VHSTVYLSVGFGVGIDRSVINVKEPPVNKRFLWVKGGFQFANIIYLSLDMKFTYAY